MMKSVIVTIGILFAAGLSGYFAATATDQGLVGAATYVVVALGLFAYAKERDLLV